MAAIARAQVLRGRLRVFVRRAFDLLFAFVLDLDLALRFALAFDFAVVAVRAAPFGAELFSTSQAS
jgi:hypothetical protein